MQIGKKYRIECTGYNKGGTKRFDGICIGEEKDFYIFKHGRHGYKECFLKADFLTGWYMAKEVM